MTLPTHGKLEKLRLRAYRNPSYGEAHFVKEFVAMMNPEAYTLDYKVEYTEGKGHGSSGSQQKFGVKKPEEFAFEFLFDSTGIIDGRPRADIADDLRDFREMLVGYDGKQHEPWHFKLLWGKTCFKGRCTSLSIAYKLFNADGSPIRASCKCGFKGSIDDEQRVAKENKSSPDLTHRRTVVAGDTLPLMCHAIYGDPGYYIHVARVNGLDNFRRLKPGTEIFFPPISKAGRTP